MVFRGINNIIFILILLIQGCVTSRDAVWQSPSPEGIIQRDTSQTYILHPGDRIQLSVWGYEEFNTEDVVSSEGAFLVPIVGEVSVEGLSKGELKELLRKKLSNYIKGEINFSVIVFRTRDHLVSVLGAVSRPDNYSIIESVSIFEILSTAGGTTDEADLRNVRVYRRGDKTQHFAINLLNYFQNGNIDNIPKINPGDIVYVPVEENLVRELSEFLRDLVLLFSLTRIYY